MKLTCPRCSAQITANKVYIKDTKAHCNQCNFLFDYLGEVYRDRISKDKSKTIKLSLSETRFFEQPDQGSLTCVECKANISQNNINHHDMLAICSACDHILDFSAERHAFLSQTGKAQNHISKPRNLEFLDFETEMFFKFRDPLDFSGGAILGAMFVGLLFLFRPAPFMVIFLVIIELIFVYLLFKSFFNSKIIHVNNQHITIKSTPFGFGNNLKIAKQDVSQLYTHMYQASDSTTEKPSYEYALCMINQRGRREDMVKGFLQSEIPQFIENKVEKFWNIRNVPVSGEFAENASLERQFFS